MLFAGDESDICRTNLWLRTADRVLVRLDTFEARDFGQLFDRTRALPWEDWLPVEAEFPVSGRSVKSQLSSVPACQKIVKKAVVERLKAAYGVEWFAETGPKYSVEVALLDDQAMLTIDTSGPGLHKRGYRPLTGKAPLKETLAAALVLLSVWRPERPLVDPFCGSGTIPIEAALIGRNMAPGLQPDLLRPRPGRACRRRCGKRPGSRPARRPGPICLDSRIIGTDVDEGVLGLARFHAEKAGVAADIHFQQKTFAELSSKRPYGCVICNPPYGQRLGRIGGGPCPAPRHARRLSPLEDLVVLHPHRARRTSRRSSANRPRGGGNSTTGGSSARTTSSWDRSRSGNPKSEIRNPKQIRNSKSE